MPEEFYCTECGGTNIISDAECRWDVVTQRFGSFEVSDGGIDFCLDCSDECGGEWRDITDLKPLAKIAIHTEESKASKT